MENAGYVFAAYSVVWAVVFVYLILLLKRQRNLRRDMESLREAFKDRQAKE